MKTTGIISRRNQTYISIEALYGHVRISSWYHPNIVSQHRLRKSLLLGFYGGKGGWFQKSQLDIRRYIWRYRLQYMRSESRRNFCPADVAFRMRCPQHKVYTNATGLPWVSILMVISAPKICYSYTKCGLLWTLRPPKGTSSVMPCETQNFFCNAQAKQQTKHGWETISATTIMC